MASGHSGGANTYALFSRNHWWPRAYADVKRYVRNCHTCSRNKPSREKYQGWLKPIPPPSRRWKEVSLDYVGPFPASTFMGVTYFYILVFTDRLTKMYHYEPMVTLEARESAQIFYQTVFRLHGLPEATVSDRGSQFTSEFWKHLTSRLGIESKLSTSFHPETDGSTERANAIMEQYLRHFCNYHQDNWAELLPSAEFAANNTHSISISCTPFLANSGQHPRLGFEPISAPKNATAKTKRELVDADEFVNKMENVCQELQNYMLLAQAEQEHYANISQIPSPSYSPGDEVWLNAKNIHRARPSQKLDAKNVGPFKIRRALSAEVFELELPPTMQIHPVFHTNLLSPTENDPLPGQKLEPRPPVIAADGEHEVYVNSILDSRINKRRKNLLQYLVEWESEEPTWESWEAITNASNALSDFHRQYPEKPGPHASVRLAGASAVEGG